MSVDTAPPVTRTGRTTSARRRFLRRLGAVVALLAGAGALFQATAPDPFSPQRVPGRMVDVGGYRLHLDCTGRGGPTVVLLNGLGGTSPQWARIQTDVARSTRVCAYDRAGQAWSDGSPHPADAVQAADDLHRLLSAAGEPGPFVLAGHSLGGAHALTLAARHPDDVAGVVLLDSVSPQQAELVPSFTREYRTMRALFTVAPVAAHLGLGRLLHTSPRTVGSVRAEQALLPVAFRQTQALTSLGSRPLVVLTAGRTLERKPGWGTAQDRLATLSTAARREVVDTDHAGLLLEDAGAARSAKAVTDVVAAVRDHTETPIR